MSEKKCLALRKKSKKIYHKKLRSVGLISMWARKTCILVESPQLCYD